MIQWFETQPDHFYRNRISWLGWNCSHEMWTFKSNNLHSGETWIARIGYICNFTSSCMDSGMICFSCTHLRLRVVGSDLTISRSWAEILTEYEKVSSSSSSTNCWGFAVHTLIWGSIWQTVSSGSRMHARTRRRRQSELTRARPRPHLLLCDLHVQDDVVDEFRQGFLHRALELVVLQQRVDKVKDAEHQVLKAQDFTCGAKASKRSWRPVNSSLKPLKKQDEVDSAHRLNPPGRPPPLCSWLLFLHKWTIC